MTTERKSTTMTKASSTRKPAAARAGTSIVRVVPAQAAPIAAAPGNANAATLRSGPTMAQEVLRLACETITQRGNMRDSNPDSPNAPQERSMDACVAAFNAIEGTNLTPRQGWAFMQTLKLTRAATSARNGLFNADDYLDGAAYAALGHEAAEAEGNPSLAFAPN